MRTKYLWLALPVAASAGAALFLLRKKSGNAGVKKASPSPEKAASAAPKTVKDASYSFISGFQNAATVELKFPYDAERFAFSVAEDEFLTESGDSHVGILSGEDFSAQFEYASYYNGESYEAFRAELASRYSDLSTVSYGGNSALMYRDGDNICLIFRVPDDSQSYLLVTLVKAKGNDDPLEALPAYPDLRFMLEGMRFSRS